MQDKRMEANMNDGRKDRTTCHEAPEADTEKTGPVPGMLQSVGEHQEFPKEEATEMLAGGLKKWCKDWNLATGRSQKLKGRIQASCDFNSIERPV
jgi:hypothetical protein